MHHRYSMKLGARKGETQIKCLRRHEKSTCEKPVSVWFSVWNNQYLNLGPPDYEFKELANGKEFSID